ncbi:MAG: DsbA family protein [Halalkalicoccus sp.]|nr:DsbA family protein [Halalkalicoccus sp.]
MKGFSRRALLASAGALSAGGLAGCLGGGTGGSGGGGNEHECSGEQRSVEVPPAGDPESDVTVTGYTDFACPHCREYAQSTYPEIESAYVSSGQIAYDHQDFPLPMDETWSWAVPNASLALFEETGAQAYYTFVEEVYQYQGEYSAENVAGLAAELGAEEEPIRAAIEDGPFCEQLVTARAEAMDRGVSATPTVFVNDTQLEAPSTDELREEIESALG